ncbi:MAG: hypothetical protein ABJF04_15880 [Reichenbachiella sp.]|uniref:hypothetical protein n=1 Tax=Reichenbachiella sp. TaxID=2184521 RepID=UPI003266F710
MKKLAVFLLLFGAIACGAKTEIPKKVMKTFKSKYKRAVNAEWISGQGVFEVSFRHETFEKVANFQEDGTWIETITYLSSDQIMTCITDYVDEYHYGGQIIEAEFVENPDKEIYSIIVEGEIESYDEDPYDEDNRRENHEESIQLMFDADCSFLEGE